MNDHSSMEQTDLPTVSFDEFEPTDYETWKSVATAALKGAPFEKKLFTKTYEGITLEPIYTREDIKDNPRTEEYPGCKDFMRGTKASGYLSKPWIVAQAAEDVLPADANKTLAYELAKGSQAAHIKLSSATLSGRDLPGDGTLRAGVYISDLKDMQDALNGIDLSQTPIHIYTGPSPVPVLGLIAARTGADQMRSFSGCIGADPIAHVLGEGNDAFDLDQMCDELAQSMKWAKDNMPNVRTILIQGNSCYHNAGANAVQEAAYALTEAIYYIDALLDRGLDIDTIAQQIRFCFSLGANFFMEIAKLRAVRILWAQIVEAYGGSQESRKADIFARNSYFTETTYDPYVNVLRATSQTFSGVVGGVNTMQVATFDEAIGPYDEQSRRIARNMQLMFQNEFDMLQPVDPAGGSWYIETLTDQVVTEIWEKVQSISAGGGILTLLKSGEIQKEIGEVLASRQTNLASRKDSAVGTNMYPNMTEKPIEKPWPNAADIQSALQKRGGNTGSGSALLRALPDQLQGAPAAFMQAVIDAFMSGASVSELRHALGGVLAAPEMETLAVHRWTEKFEALRQKTEAFKARTGQDIKVFLANMGPIPQHKARADFITGFMEVAAFDVMKNDGFETVEAAAKAACASGADAIVICSTDKTYPELVPPLARLIKAELPDTAVYLAGAPSPDYKDAYLNAGVADFIHVKSNCYETLKNIQEKKGIL